MQAEIDNPDYKPDPNLYLRDEICAIGFDLWQVKSGTIFGKVLITDDPDLAKKIGEEVWKPMIVSIIVHYCSEWKFECSRKNLFQSVWWKSVCC